MPPSRARRYIGQLVMSMPPRRTLPAFGVDHAASHAEAGRLAGAVGAQQSDDLAAVDAKIDLIDHAATAVGLHQSLNFQHRRAGLIRGDGRRERQLGRDDLRFQHPWTPYLTSPIFLKFGKNGNGISVFPIDILSHECGQKINRALPINKRRLTQYSVLPQTRPSLASPMLPQRRPSLLSALLSPKTKN